MTNKPEMAQAEIPEIIKDPTRSNTNYERGRFLGKGGFAKCYELRHMVNNEISAGKIVPKSLLVKQHQREKNGPRNYPTQNPAAQICRQTI